MLRPLVDVDQLRAPGVPAFVFIHFIHGST
jgi:hypothetical protein